MGDYSTVYSKNTLFAIKEYLEKNIYPNEITSLDCQKTKKNRKRNFREIVRKNQRFKLDKSNENKECIVLYKNWNWNQDKKKRSKIVTIGDQEVYHLSNDSGIKDWYIIPEVWKA